MARSKIWERIIILTVIITSVLWVKMVWLGEIISALLVGILGGTFLVFSIYKCDYWQKKDEFLTVEIETFIKRSQIWFFVGILEVGIVLIMFTIISLKYDFLCGLGLLGAGLCFFIFAMYKHMYWSNKEDFTMKMFIPKSKIWSILTIIDVIVTMFLMTKILSFNNFKEIVFVGIVGIIFLILAIYKYKYWRNKKDVPTIIIKTYIECFKIQIVKNIILIIFIAILTIIVSVKFGIVKGIVIMLLSTPCIIGTIRNCVYWYNQKD